MQSGTSSGVPIVGMLCILFAGLLLAAFFIYVWGTIFKKAGYSFWMALLMPVPIANFIWLLMFAFSKWPIERELESYRGTNSAAPGGFPVLPPQQ